MDKPVAQRSLKSLAALKVNFFNKNSRIPTSWALNENKELFEKAIVFNNPPMSNIHRQIPVVKAIVKWTKKKSSHKIQ